MSRIYIGIITDSGKFDSLNALTAPYTHFDGLAVTYHGKPEDNEYKLLMERKKGGFVECIKYLGHHAHSMNHFLFNPQICLGDWILLRDTDERINEEFAANIRPFIKILENNGINSVYQHSKLLLFKRFPHQQFNSTPHWGFHGAQSKMIKIEETTWFKDDSEYCYSVRNENRDKYSFIDHFMRYYLINDSNHNLLGLENFGDPNILFPILESKRILFLEYLNKINVNNNTESLKKCILEHDLSPEFKVFFNSNLILNQFYRYHVLNDLTVSPDIKAPIVKIS